MKLLKLTGRDTGLVYVSANAIAGINAHRSGSFVRTIGCTDEMEYAVQETPEQIAAMLAEDGISPLERRLATLEAMASMVTIVADANGSERIEPVFGPQKSALEAAAPELLEALRAALASMQESYRRGMGCDAATIAAASIAIARAEGRS